MFSKQVSPPTPFGPPKHMTSWRAIDQGSAFEPLLLPGRIDLGMLLVPMLLRENSLRSYANPAHLLAVMRRASDLQLL